MKTKSALYIIISVIFLSGCLSGGAPKETKAYIAGYFEKFDHNFTLKNLETNKIIRIKIKANEEFSLSPITPGKYAVIQISGSGYKVSYSVEIPEHLKTIIFAEPGTVTFLGKISYTMVDEGFKLWDSTKKGNIHIEYPIERFSNEFELKYIDLNMKIKPLELTDYPF